MTEDRVYYSVADWNRALTIEPAWGSPEDEQIDEMHRATTPRSVVECQVPPLPATFAAMLNRGTRRDGQR